MASINIHYTFHDVKPTPEIKVDVLPSGTQTLRVNALGHDDVTFFFEDRDDVINFVDLVNQALTAFLQANERE